MKAKLHFVLSIAMFLFVFSAFAQNSTWKKIENGIGSKKISKLHLENSNVHLFELNSELLKKDIKATPLRGFSKKQSTNIISVPGQDGKLERFKLYEAPVFSPELAAKYPEIKSYLGVSLDHSEAQLRMSVSPQGVQTMISYIDKPTIFMQPISKGSNQYVVYKRADKNYSKDQFECKTIDDLNKTFNKNNSKTSKINEGGANDKTLKKFRIAVSVTGEYTAYHGGTVAGALAGINATLARVNQVFETDMAIRFELINATQLIYTNAATDPYSDANVGADEDNFNNLNGWSLQIQNNLTNVIGNNAYDIGHLFGATGGGGNAGCIGCVCENDNVSDNFTHNKGSAFTSPASGGPQGDTFDLDFVAHEIGHQMGANHTWAFESEGTGVNSEPGSGTTVMAYAGIQGADNVALHNDAYFHYHSIKQILTNVATKTCQTTEVITNNSPVANAGSNYSIPKGTAYVLKGSATDLDGLGGLTYCWEQIDSGVTNYLNFGPGLTTGSMNRSLPPSSSTDRYIPKLSSVVAGNTTQTTPNINSDWETVSNVARTLNWALTVRDKAPASATGGQTSYDTMEITVEDVTPFTVTNPISWIQNTSATINWEEGQTTNATINCQNVTIKLSTDGGATFPTTIATNTLNDGSHTFTVPSMANTTSARILIEAADNIFYDVSDFDFNISPNPGFFMVEATLDPIACKDTAATFHFNYAPYNGFSETTTFSAAGNPSGSSVTFSPTSRNTTGTVTMVVSDLGTTPEGDYPLIITGTPTSASVKTKNVNLAFFNGSCASVGNTDYDTSTTLVQFNTINNTSAKPSGYSNYKAISTDVNRNSSYNLTVNVNTAGNYTTNTFVWVDWNQDCDFDDANEQYNLGSVTNVTNGATGNSGLSITIPVGALLGNTTMRVSTKYDVNPTSCEIGADAEVEDYTINIQPTLAIEELGFENFIVFPNPNKGNFNIKLNGALSRKIDVDIFDLRGRAIYKNTFNDVGDFNETIRLNHAQSGMYFLIVCDGLRKSTKKIIID